MQQESHERSPHLTGPYTRYRCLLSLLPARMVHMILIARMAHKAFMTRMTHKVLMIRITLMPLLPLLALPHPAAGQAAGDNTYGFLSLSHSAFVNATGGFAVSSGYHDLSLVYYNPALLHSSMDREISLSLSSWVAGINYGYASMACNTATAGAFSGGVSFISYGSFTGADEAGNLTGSFTASEYAFHITWAWEIDSLFTAGITMKPVLSHLERYFSAGLCFDLGATYHNEQLLLDAGLVIRNAGMQLISYTGRGGEPLPFEIIAGATKRLPHAPFSFTLTLKQLEKPDLVRGGSSDGSRTRLGKAGENVLRHMIVGMEVIPAESFRIGAGLNYRRRAEMRLGERAGMAGFTAGFSVNTKFFRLAYAHDAFHNAGGSNHLTISLKPELLFGERKRVNHKEDHTF